MEYQYVIIGSGIAGTTIAGDILRSNNKASILMLEAGPKIQMKDLGLWWEHVISDKTPYDFCKDLSVGDKENMSVGKTPWVFRDSRVMTFGGSTVRWGGWTPRMKPEDFELFSRTGQATDWPITYNDLEPFYCSAEDLMGVSGDSSDNYVPRSKTFPLEPFPYTNSDGIMIDAFDNLGISYSKMPLARHQHCMTIGTCNYCPLGAKYSASDVLDVLLNNKSYPNFTVMSEAPVSELIVDSKEIVTGANYFDKTSGETKTARGKCFIVCSGTYESPKLLQNSKSEYWHNGIGNDKDLVGRFLTVHPFLYVRGKHSNNPMKMQKEVDFPTLISRHYDTPEEQANGKLFLLKSRSRPNLDLSREMIKGTPKDKLLELSVGEMEVEIQGFMEEFSNMNNRVEIGKGKNRFGLPQTKVNFSWNQGFEERVNKRLDIMKNVINNMGFDIVMSGIRPVRGEHAASTCKMNNDHKYGVVDANLKVHGTDNLYICSNAVFPNLGAASPTLTLAALSLRLADHIQKKL